VTLINRAGMMALPFLVLYLTKNLGYAATTAGLVITIYGFGANIFAVGLLSAALSVVIWTFGEMVFLPGAAAYMAEIAPAERRGEYMGLYQMTFSIGFTLSGWTGTTLFQCAGSSMLWTIMFLTGCISAAALWRIDKKTSTA